MRNHVKSHKESGHKILRRYNNVCQFQISERIKIRFSKCCKVRICFPVRYSIASSSTSVNDRSRRCDWASGLAFCLKALFFNYCSSTTINKISKFIHTLDQITAKDDTQIVFIHMLEHKYLKKKPKEQRRANQHEEGMLIFSLHY